MRDTSKSFVYYTTSDGEDKSNTPMSLYAKRFNQNPCTDITKDCVNHHLIEISLKLVFKFLKNCDFKDNWIRFVNSKNWQPSTSSVILCKLLWEKVHWKMRSRKDILLEQKSKVSYNNISSQKNPSLPIIWAPRIDSIYRFSKRISISNFLSRDTITYLNSLNELDYPLGY